MYNGLDVRAVPLNSLYKTSSQNHLWEIIILVSHDGFWSYILQCVQYLDGGDLSPWTSFELRNIGLGWELVL